MNKTLRGNQLSAEDCKHVLAGYVYRKTFENVKAHPAAVAKTGNTLPLISDAQWLAITDFEVTAKGRLSLRSKFCMTHDCEIPERKAIINAWSASQKAA